MNQGNLEVVKQEMARVNGDILGIRVEPIPFPHGRSQKSHFPECSAARTQGCSLVPPEGHTTQVYARKMRRPAQRGLMFCW